VRLWKCKPRERGKNAGKRKKNGRNAKSVPRQTGGREGASEVSRGGEWVKRAKDREIQKKTTKKKGVDVKEKGSISSVKKKTKRRIAFCSPSTPKNQICFNEKPGQNRSPVRQDGE